MSTYAVLLRGINVGGKNKIPMADLKACLEDEGFGDVATYIQSGNALLRSDLDASAVEERIERLLPTRFAADGAAVRVVAIEHSAYRRIVEGAPRGFGEDPATFRYNTVFLLGVASEEAMAADHHARGRGRCLARRRRRLLPQLHRRGVEEPPRQDRGETHLRVAHHPQLEHDDEVAGVARRARGLGAQGLGAQGVATPVRRPSP